VGLIHELPLRVLKGNTVVEPTFSVKSQKEFFFFYEIWGINCSYKEEI